MMIRTMKSFLEVLLENYQGLRWCELVRELKNKNILSSTESSEYLKEGKRLGLIEEVKDRYFITQRGADWIKDVSLMENLPEPEDIRNSKENPYGTIGIITSTTDCSFQIQTTSTITATNMEYPETSQMNELKEMLSEFDYKCCSWLERNGGKELLIAKRYVKNISEKNPSEWIRIKQIKVRKD